jgi:hypothetical protein
MARGKGRAESPLASLQASTSAMVPICVKEQAGAREERGGGDAREKDSSEEQETLLNMATIIHLLITLAVQKLMCWSPMTTSSS